MSDLTGRVAVVTGASRGIGRGVAHELGLAGATVFVTGRSRAGGETVDDRPETIDETAELVTAAGGRGIPVVCDHTADENIAALADVVRRQAGHLDVLVHCAWGGYEGDSLSMYYDPPWEQPLWRWDKMMDTGVRAQYATTVALLPLMRGRDRPLVVHISAGDDGKFLGDVQYDVAKAAVNRLGHAFGQRLRGEGIAAVVLHPGLTRTERVEAEAPEDELEDAHSARFVGRVVLALANDPDLMARTGGVFKVGQLSLDYDLRDIDGRQPQPFMIPDYEA